MNNLKFKFQKGFTGAELLVVLVLISLVTWLTLGQLNQSKIESRIAERQFDLLQIKWPLELYRSQNGYYPASLTEEGLNIDYYVEVSTDPSGGTILVSATEEESQPEHGYTAQKPNGPQYTYSAYNCYPVEDEQETDEVDETETTEESEDTKDEKSEDDSQDEKPKKLNCRNYVLYGWREGWQPAKADDQFVPIEIRNIQY